MFRQCWKLGAAVGGGATRNVQNPEAISSYYSYSTCKEVIITRYIAITSQIVLSRGFRGRSLKNYRVSSGVYSIN